MQETIAAAKAATELSKGKVIDFPDNHGTLPKQEKKYPEYDTCSCTKKEICPKCPVRKHRQWAHKLKGIDSGNYVRTIPPQARLSNRSYKLLFKDCQLKLSRHLGRRATRFEVETLLKKNEDMLRKQAAEETKKRLANIEDQPIEYECSICHKKLKEDENCEHTA